MQWKIQKVFTSCQNQMGASSLSEALLSSKPSTFVGKTPCPFNSFQMIPE